MFNDVNLSPIILEFFTYQNREFVICPELKINVVLDDSKQLLVAIDETMGIYAYEPTYQQLLEEIVKQIVFNWDQFVVNGPDNLSKGAVNIRTCYLDRVSELE